MLTGFSFYLNKIYGFSVRIIRNWQLKEFHRIKLTKEYKRCNFE